VGSLREFGNWWTIRNSADVDVVGRTVHLGLKNTIDGLVLEVPRGWTLGSVQPSSVKAEQQGNRVILSNAGGKVQVHFN
jgi:hypothetical protein